MSVEESIFESKVPISHAMRRAMLYTAFVILILAFQKNFLLMSILILWWVLLLFYGFITKTVSFEVLAYGSFFTLKKSKILETINYRDIDSIKIVKFMNRSYLNFFLKDNKILKIPVEEIQKFNLFKKIIAEKIEPERIDWGK